MQISYEKAISLVNEIIGLYPNVEFTNDEKADLVIVAMQASANSWNPKGPEAYVKSTIVNCIKDKVKQYVITRLGE